MSSSSPVESNRLDPTDVSEPTIKSLLHDAKSCGDTVPLFESVLPLSRKIASLGK